MIKVYCIMLFTIFLSNSKASVTDDSQLMKDDLVLSKFATKLTVSVNLDKDDQNLIDFASELPSDRREMLLKYAGKGLSFDEAYAAARADGLEKKDLFSPKRQITPTYSQGSVEGQNRDDQKPLSPFRVQPKTIYYESKSVERLYNSYFAISENDSEKKQFDDFITTVSEVGLKPYNGKMQNFYSEKKAYKINIGCTARIIFRIDGDSICLIGDPDHYGRR